MQCSQIRWILFRLKGFYKKAHLSLPFIAMVSEKLGGKHGIMTYTNEPGDGGYFQPFTLIGSKNPELKNNAGLKNQFAQFTIICMTELSADALLQIHACKCKQEDNYIYNFTSLSWLNKGVEHRDKDHCFSTTEHPKETCQWLGEYSC